MVGVYTLQFPFFCLISLIKMSNSSQLSSEHHLQWLFLQDCMKKININVILSEVCEK